MDFESMMDYVKDVLTNNNAICSKNPNHRFRNRYMHSVRVYKWCKRLLPDFPECDTNVLYTAAIFHDIGYAKDKQNHAYSSSLMFEEYAKANDFDLVFTKKVSDIIRVHSDKSLLKNPESKPELIILLEADLLDEEGALGILWDLMAEGSKENVTYYTALDEIWAHSGHILGQDFMVSPLAKKYWKEKQELERSFITGLQQDLFIGE